MINLNKFIIGCAQSDENYGLDKTKKFGEVLDYSVKKGITSYDTAENYKKSHLFLKNFSNKKNFVFQTKLNFNCKFTKNFRNEIKYKLNNVFKKNGLTKFYCIFVHDPILPLYKHKWKIIFSELNKLKKSGKIKKIGISVYSKNELNNILKIFKPDVVQFPLNVFDQSFGDLKYLKYLKSKKIETQARSIFLQGLLLKKNFSLNQYFKIWKEDFVLWEKFLKKNNLKSYFACLKFVLQNPYVDKIVIGMNNKKQFSQFINTLKEINNKKNLKIKYSENSRKDDFLINPRYWSLNKNKNLSNFKKWKKTKNKILFGGMLLSKKPERFLPGGWPTFYNKAKGCLIWDNENKKYIDFSLMGIGTNILGYSNSKVNARLKKVISDSNITTLNSNYDKLLSEKLIELHPWADKAFFARTGAEINAISVRLGRAFSGRDQVAICGYHGWHDWYLSTNLSNTKNLDNIHLKGLSTIGIPKKLNGLTHPFKYNDIKGFKALLDKNLEIGTVFMEVERNMKPKKGFLESVREETSKRKIVLIFDECTSGFREKFGGLHKKYNVNPDIAVFGKAIGNGIPITALITKNQISLKSNKSFISSTFWTDALGPAAALETINEMGKLKSWNELCALGKKIKKFWKLMSLKYDVKIKIFGLDSMPSFEFIGELSLYYKTFFIQEFLKHNFLATTSVYCSISHKPYLSRYFNIFEKIFKKISILKNESIYKHVEYPLVHTDFERLN